MKITATPKFEPCPEYHGRAVCVDVTEPKQIQTEFGPKNVFRIVFEIDLERNVKIDGKDEVQRWAVWSRGFTESLGERAALRKFLKDWFGRDLNAEELAGFETENLIGKPAFLIISHTTEGNEAYANIHAITPDKSGNPLQPSGKFIRKKDRDAKKDVGHRQTQSPASSTSPLPGSGPAAGSNQPPSSWTATKVHVGRFKGTELRELAPDSIDALVTHWLPTAKANPKATADDRRLVAALETYVEQKTAAAPEPEPDEVPY